MHDLRRFIPSPHCLFVFEAVSRRLSFTEAARELNVSQPAVSKTIRNLEETCGLKLVVRQKYGVSLTPAGTELAEEVSRSFNSLSATFQKLTAQPPSLEVRAAFAPAFVSMWLLPRLHLFKAEFPQVRLNISHYPSGYDEFDLDRSGVDLSVKLGLGNWEGLNAHPCLYEEVQVLCTHDYLRKNGPIETPADLLGQPLLHFQEQSRRRMSWEDWFALHNLERNRGASDMVFSDHYTAVQAAMLGQGVILSWTHLVEDFLNSGQLVNPLGSTIRSGKLMYLVTSSRRAPSLGTVLFRDWLLRELASYTEASR